MDAVAKSLAEAIRRAFPTHPVPAYPPLLGLDPVGVDEYAAFANVPWTDVPPVSHRWAGYDICPTIGMKESPPMWSYHFPGFMTSSLLFEHEHEVLDGLLWQLRDLEPPPRVLAAEPWWGGATFFANYSRAQVDCVVRFLRFLREHGGDEPYSREWEPEDERLLLRWEAATSR